jgi:hypothetical protein
MDTIKMVEEVVKMVERSKKELEGLVSSIFFFTLIIASTVSSQQIVTAENMHMPLYDFYCQSCYKKILSE